MRLTPPPPAALPLPIFDGEDVLPAAGGEGDHAKRGGGVPWITTRSGLPYFLIEDGEPWHPVGANDAVEWPELNPLFRGRDPAAVEAHLRYLRDHGVTVVRLMLEYAHKHHRFLEKPAGVFVPNMVRFWDDLVALCERTGMRLLLTPLDTFFTYINWARHPWNRANGGPVKSRRELLSSPQARALIKARLEWATTRYGGSGAVFAWDLYNEAHPAHARDDPHAVRDYIADMAPWMRALETRLHGRAHPLTVSIFGPELVTQPVLNDYIFRAPELDFANTHLYEHGTIDDPKNTVDAALAAARLIRDAVEQTRDARPVFDSEHGPIHRFKDKRRSLPAAFDDEYFRHIQWAHLASGGAGGGMRWPNRSPKHVLTPGMREEQRKLSAFLPLVDWARFHRQPVDALCSDPGLAVTACADDTQAVVFLLRTGSFARDGRVAPKDDAPPSTLAIPGLGAGRCGAVLFDPQTGTVAGAAAGTAAGLALPPVRASLMLAVSRAG